MNVITLLRQDHQKVKSMFSEMQQAQDATINRQMVMEVISELEVHATVEEEIVYPAFRAVQGLNEKIDEGIEEHQSATMLMEELRVMSAGDDSFHSRLEQLIASVQHHIQEEESVVFPQAESLGEPRLVQLGQQAEERKNELQKNRMAA